jgi:hypothetical protein
MKPVKSLLNCKLSFCNIFFSDHQSDPCVITLITAGVVVLLLIMVDVIFGRMRSIQNRKDGQLLICYRDFSMF